MKIKLFLPTILLLPFATVSTFGQIPNSGFENWGTITDTCDTDITVFDNPNAWRGSFQAPCTPPYSYSIEKNIDNYPSGTGSFSIKIKSDVVKEVRGIASIETGNPSPMAPAFSITGHPTSLTGYYKFLPLNGDTMNIVVVLFQSGAMVAGGTLTGTATTSSWTSFNVPISAYSTADSALIFLGSYNISGGTLPHGNSALYIDNLNFDNLITGIKDIDDGENKISVYPNPFFFESTLQTKSIFNNATLTVYNSFGQQVKQIKNISGQTFTFHRDNLPSGLYFIRLTQDGKPFSTDKLVITDIE